MERTNFIKLMASLHDKWEADEIWMNEIELEFGDVPSRILIAIIETQRIIAEEISEAIGDKKDMVKTLLVNDFDFKVLNKINSFSELYDLIKEKE